MALRYNPAKDYYDILGVHPSASEASIRKAYYQIALLHHPDKHTGSAKATAIFQGIQEAWEVLADEKLRSQYNAVRAQCILDLGPAPKPRPRHPTMGRASGPSQTGLDPEHPFERPAGSNVPSTSYYAPHPESATPPPSNITFSTYFNHDMSETPFLGELRGAARDARIEFETAVSRRAGIRNAVKQGFNSEPLLKEVEFMVGVMGPKLVAAEIERDKHQKWAWELKKARAVELKS